MDRNERKHIEELLVSDGWAIFKIRALGPDKMEGDKVVRQSLQTQIRTKLESEARKGDGVKAAYFQGQLDILQRILDLPKITMAEKG